MFVYDLFKYEGTEIGKSLGLYSNFDKAFKEAKNYFSKMYGDITSLSYDKENKVFTIKLSNETITNDWLEIKEIKVK